MTFHAIYENGILRPTAKLDLPDPCEIDLEIRHITEEVKAPSLDDVYEILGRRHASGEHDLAARHNEHQP